MPRVLIAEGGAVVRLGLREVLQEGGVDIVADEAPAVDVLGRMVAALPDVVVLDLDEDGADDRARRLAVEFPSVKVIACSVMEPTMRVFPPFHHGESYLCELSPLLLLEAVNSFG